MKPYYADESVALYHGDEWFEVAFFSGHNAKQRALSEAWSRAGITRHVADRRGWVVEVRRAR